jgi:hypothetical protein
LVRNRRTAACRSLSSVRCSVTVRPTWRLNKCCSREGLRPTSSEILRMLGPVLQSRSKIPITPRIRQSKLWGASITTRAVTSLSSEHSDTSHSVSSRVLNRQSGQTRVLILSIRRATSVADASSIKTSPKERLGCEDSTTSLRKASENGARTRTPVGQASWNVPDVAGLPRGSCNPTVPQLSRPDDDRTVRHQGEVIQPRVLDQ